jgi:hypothetical protein
MKNKRVELDQYLSSYNEQIGLLARNVRNMILELIPEMDEVIKWKNLFYEKNGFVCAIISHKDHVNLQFARGIELKDSTKMLEGSGKKIRHVKIYDSDLINTEQFKNLIIEAVNLNIS